jgi:hypothetical protein
MRSVVEEDESSGERELVRRVNTATKDFKSQT